MGTNKKNLISVLLFRFSLLLDNEVTQAASWPLANTGRTGTGRAGKWLEEWWPLVHTATLLYFPFSLKWISLPRTTNAFSRLAASSRLLLPLLYLSFAPIPPFPAPFLFFFPLLRFMSSYLWGTWHKYISVRQMASLNFATRIPRTFILHTNANEFLIR